MVGFRNINDGTPDPPPPTVTEDEVVALLRQAAERSVAVTLYDPTRTWGKVHTGNVAFVIGEAKVTFYNDHGELDYVDECIIGDRRGESARWKDMHLPDPLDGLAGTERAQLEQVLSEAK